MTNDKDAVIVQVRMGSSQLPGAEAYYRRALTLPLFADMEDCDGDRVVAALAATLGTG